MTLKHTDSDLSAALAKGREEAAQWHDREADRIRNMAQWGEREAKYIEAIGNHEEAAAAIRALSPSSPGEPAGSGWQPIATAPKDGTPILIHVPQGRRKVYEASYHTPYEDAPHDQCWWQTAEGRVLPENAIEWQPLHAPPAEPKD